MAGLNAQQSIILAKIETTKGTEAVPAAADDYLIVNNFNPMPFDGTMFERDFLGGKNFTNPAAIVAAKYSGFGGDVELTASGTAGTAPRAKALLRMMGLEETVVAGTSVSYTQRSEDFEGATIHAYMDGTRYRALGAVASGKLIFDAGKIPIIQATVSGQHKPLTDTALPSVVVAPQIPLGINSANATLSVHGFSVTASKFELDLGQTVEKIDMIGATDVYISNMKPKGRLVFRFTDVADKDWLDIVEESTEGALDFDLGSTAGKIIKIDASKVSLGNPQFEIVNGQRYLGVDLNFAPNSSGDPYTLKFE